MLTSSFRNHDLHSIPIEELFWEIWKRRGYQLPPTNNDNTNSNNNNTSDTNNKKIAAIDYSNYTFEFFIAAKHHRFVTHIPEDDIILRSVYRLDKMNSNPITTTTNSNEETSIEELNPYPFAVRIQFLPTILSIGYISLSGSL